jgi:hypothetical protein
MSIKNYHQGDTAYWDKVHTEIRSGGREAFLHHLMYEVDIEDFFPERIPSSLDASRWQMKVHALSEVDRFLLKALTNPDEYTQRDYEDRPDWFFIESPENTTYKLLIDRNFMFKSYFNSSQTNKRHAQQDSFINSVLTSFQSGTHSTEEQRVLHKNFRCGFQNVRNSRIGIKCSNTEDGFTILRQAFACGCRTPVEVIFPDMVNSL